MDIISLDATALKEIFHKISATDVTVFVTNSIATFYYNRLASGVQTSQYTCVPNSFYRSRSSWPSKLSPLNTFGYAALL